MQENFKFLHNRKLSILLFIGFLIVNFYYFILNFFNTFLNPNNNGDEYYQYRLYSISNFSFENFFYASSQPFIFLSSLIDYFLESAKHSTRLVSLIAGTILIIYFLRRIISSKNSKLENIYKSTLFICAIFITNQIFIGTSDFLSVALGIPPFLIILENIKNKKLCLDLNQSILVGIFFGLSVATRPTTLVLIGAFYLTLFFLIGLKPLFYKKNFIIASSFIVIISFLNFLPIIEQQKIILDVKEIPEETGVNWFEMNYLMAKYSGSNKISNTTWITTQEVIDFKKENPNFEFPKNQFDLLLTEPGLYCRQMIRMLVKAMYSNYRFMYMLFPLLFLSFLHYKKLNKIRQINNTYDKLFQNKFVIIFHFISILFFSFLAVKFFEFRWVIAPMILYCFYSLNYLSHFPLKIRFLIYNVSFLSGIGLYLLFFIRHF